MGSIRRRSGEALAACVEIVGPMTRCGAKATHELCSKGGEPLMHLCADHAAWWRRALGDLVMPLEEA